MRVVRLIVIGSACCLVLGILVGFFYALLLMADIYVDSLLIAIVCLFGAGFLLSIAGIVGIFVTRTCWLGLIPTIIALLICGAIMYVFAELEAGVRRRAKKMKEVSPYYNLKKLGDALIQYAEDNSGYLPSAENWCDSLLKENPKLTRENFKHPQADYLGLRGDCQFAFNKKLSGMKLSDISDDVVLIFEADGDWNLNGTDELFKKRYDVEGCIALLYINGTKRDYWFYKQAVRTVDKSGKHLYYIKPRWK